MVVKEILSLLHDWAPPGIAKSYDNVGLQVGDPDQEISVGLVALEVTPEVVTEAEETGAQLIVTHHPLLFRPIRSLSKTSLVGSMALRLAQSGISLIAAHTNLDSVKDGVSAALADLIGLSDRSTLAPVSDGMLKLVTFVPAEAVEQVRVALSQAGSGRIGDYDNVSFKNEGIGLFRPLASAKPLIGTAGGDVERIPEWRIEVALAGDQLRRVVGALLQAHPYETPVYDVYEMRETVSGFGLGMIGNLDATVTLSEFIGLVCRKLDATAVRYVGDLSALIRRVAVCGGAGRDLIPNAMAKGADVYLTADITYHSFFDVLAVDGSPRMALIDAGHYETEAAAEQLLLDWLRKNVSETAWSRTKIRTSPVATFLAG